MERNYWIHRISYCAEVSYPLLEKGILSIGFSDFSSKDFVENTIKDWNLFEAAFRKEWGNVPRNRYSLWRFIRDMKKGDYIIVPSWGTFSVYELESDEIYITDSELLKGIKDTNGIEIIKQEDGYLHFNNKNNEILDLGFFRKVKQIKINISRTDFADSALTSRLKIRQTNANIDNIKGSVLKAINSCNEDEPINLHGQLLDKFQSETLKTIKENLNPDKFEKLIKWYFIKTGANEVTIPPKNENGKEGDVDIIASFEAIKTIIYIQAKFHEGVTDSWAVNQVTEYRTQKEKMDDGYNRIAWVITTAEQYTHDSYAKAKENLVLLIDGMEFTKMLLEIGISELNSAMD